MQGLALTSTRTNHEMHIYLGTFLIAFSGLALEVTLSRLLSVMAWYHLAFLAVSTAMLGMTAGATTVYLRPGWFSRERLAASLARACHAYALSIPAVLVLLCLIPIELPLEPRRMVMGFAALTVAILCCSLPFYFSGIVVSAVLTRSSLPVGKLYAFDLVGAAGGCLLVLGALLVLSAPSCILLCAVIGALAGLAYAWKEGQPRLRRQGALVLLLTAVVLAANVSYPFGVRPVVVKGAVEEPERIYIERWNSFSRVTVYEQRMLPGHQWAGSVNTPRNLTLRHFVNIDGEAGTTIQQFIRPQDVEHLRYDLTSAAYHLRPTGGAAVIGVGGGRDVQAALLFGHKRVLGIEVNPIFIDLARREFRDFSCIASRPEVELIVDEARSRLSRTSEHFAVVQMSLVDTWAATGAGAFSLTENALYTVEAWQVFLDRLKPDGVFTVSRWYSPVQIAETGRVVSLAVAALMRLGVTDPSRHMAMLTNQGISTLLLSRSAFGPADVAAIGELAARMEFQIQFAPGQTPANPVLRTILAAKDLDDLERRVDSYPLNLQPATDESPYFFNMLRLGHIREAFGLKGAFILAGNLSATLMLLGSIIALMLVAIATIVVPLRWLTPQGQNRAQRGPVCAASIAYFCLIGAGFMSIEMALIQRLSIFLGHPIYGLGVLLFTIILSTGIGSALSERLSLARRRLLIALPILAAAAALLLDQVVSHMLTSMITLPTLTKALLSIASILPLGLVLGYFFPIGMRLNQRVDSAQSPWYWALNGAFSVLFAALSVLISIYLSVSANFNISAACYAALLICIPKMLERHQACTAGQASVAAASPDAPRSLG